MTPTSDGSFVWYAYTRFAQGGEDLGGTFRRPPEVPVSA